MEGVEDLRERAITFLDNAQAEGQACGEFGAIMPPSRFEPARRWQQALYEAGFAGLHWPVECGGQGLTLEHEHVWLEECARRGVAAYMNFQGYILAGGAIRAFGTDEQKAQYLQATLAADIVWCQLFSEPGSGSDLASLTTKAEPDGDGWVVTGQKVWTSTAQLAQHAILLARTDLGEVGHGGISFFLVDMAAPGIDVRPIRQMTNDEEFCEVFLDHVPIASDQLLGPLHGGWRVATSVLADERAAVGAVGVGLRRSIQDLQAHIDPTDAAEVDQFMPVHVKAGSLGALLQRSGGDPMLGPLTKLGRTELASDMTRFALDSRGPAGMVHNDATEPFLYAPGMRVAGGTSEIQRNLIGERLLGLPREPKARE